MINKYVTNPRLTKILCTDELLEYMRILNQAIYLLLQENNDTSGSTTETLERIEEVLEEMKMLGYI